MRAISKAAIFVAGVHLVAVTAPSVAWAQAAQPVPYGTAPPPVNYGQTAPTTPPAPAAPRSAGSDVITLKNGGILRGTIIDAIPNAQARIQLLTGEIATVPWSEIARIENAKSAPPAPPAAAPAAAPAATTVIVHVDSPESVELQRDAGNKAWATVCASPCDQPIPTGGKYRFAGGGIRPSAPFAVPTSNTGRVYFTVSPSSSGWFVAGIVMLSVGAPVMLVSLVVAALAGLVSAVSSNASGNNTSQDATDTADGALLVALIAAGVTVGGIVALASNSRSGVSVSSDAAPAQGTIAPWMRAAAWREATPEQRLLPAAQTVPVLRVAF